MQCLVLAPGNEYPLVYVHFKKAAMPTVDFTPDLQRHIHCPTQDVEGCTVLEALRKVLPHTSSCDLAYRHGLDIDACGDCLMMGSTTANLRVSEDKVDTWRCLSNYHPPVYAVRFVD